MSSPSTPKKLINLIRGWPSPSLLPTRLLQSATTKLLSSSPQIFVPALQYGPDPGYQPLREALAVWLSAAYRTPTKPEQIDITGGASQSIANLLSSYTDPAYTRAVWLVAPCYFLACPIFEDAGFGGRMRAIPEDEEGIDLHWLGRGLKEVDERRNGDEEPKYKPHLSNRKIYRHIIYAVPTCANPSGKSMSLRRRQGLVDLARHHDALIICDDVYDFLQWPIIDPSSTTTPPAPLPTPYPLLPRLSDIDIPLGPTKHDPPGKHFGHAVSNGSFSKLVAPGVRTGWVHGTADFAHGVSATGATRSGGAPSQLCAAIICEMLASGELEDHLTRNVRPGLQARHAAAMAAVKRVLGWVGVEVLGTSEAGKETFGGYFLWLTLPEGFDTKAVAERAQREENLVVAPGSNFEVAGDEEVLTFPRNLRLCYSWEEEADIVQGIERLGAILRRMSAGEGEDVIGRGQVEGVEEVFK
ncbi:pyridoxal phosphate-dependent transferase [Apodospora peruviana]|uniref:Pyridoxal phosphate-dependent transferase n=1 Tax=Apodospora peruviana TaxID=516989 RepID=A0AAE0I6E6_9PEZI|nr:pyridoxal phosphate-dependent transferase [Apodospora peruviana]